MGGRPAIVSATSYIPPAPVFRTSGLMLNPLDPFSRTLNHIFVMYTHERTLKVHGRPLIQLDPFDPSFRANVEPLGPTFLDF